MSKTKNSKDYTPNANGSVKLLGRRNYRKEIRLGTDEANCTAIMSSTNHGVEFI